MLSPYSKYGLRAVGVKSCETTLLLQPGNSRLNVSRSDSIGENTSQLWLSATWISFQFRLHIKWLSFCVINYSKLINYCEPVHHLQATKPPSACCTLSGVQISVCLRRFSENAIYIYAILVHSIFVLVHMDGHIYTYTHIDFCYVSPYSKRVLYNEGAAISSPETWSRLSFDCTWRKVCCWKPCLPQAHVAHVRLFSLFIACAMHANVPSACSAP